MVKINDIAKEVAKELGLDANLVESIARMPWKFTWEHISNRNIDPVTHIYLGKFYMKKSKLELLQDPEKVEALHKKDELRLSKYL